MRKKLRFNVQNVKKIMNRLTIGVHGGTGQLTTHLKKYNPEFARLEALNRAKKEVNQ